MHRLLQLGVSSELDEDEVRRIVIYNGLILFSHAVNLCFVILFLFMSYHHIFPLNAFTTLVFGFLQFLNYRKYVSLSRFLLIFSVNIILLLSCQVIGSGVRFEQFFVCLAVSPIIIYPFKRRKEMLVACFITIFCSIIAILGLPVIPPSAIFLEPLPQEQIVLMNLIITPSVIFLTFIFPASMYVLAQRDFADLIRAKEKEVENSRMASLGQMAAGIAHEINNPLSIISGRAELLGMMSKKLDSENEKFVRDASESIGKHTARISRIVNSLRTFARQRVEDPYINVSVDHLVNETLELCNQKIKSFCITMKVDITDGVELVCDEAQIMQVLVNLISNAVDSIQEKHGEEGGEITIKATALGEKVSIVVEDNGVGIPDHMLNSIMDPFFTTKGVGHGTGLGLSISKGILDDHGASMKVENKSTGGARFILSFDNDSACVKSGHSSEKAG